MNLINIFSPIYIEDLKILLKHVAIAVIKCGNNSLGLYTRIKGSLRGDLEKGCIVIEEGDANKIFTIIKLIFPKNISAFVENEKLFIKPNTMVLLFRTNFKGSEALKNLYEEQYKNSVVVAVELPKEDICKVCKEKKKMIGCDNCDDWWICYDCIEKDPHLGKRLKNHDQMHKMMVDSMEIIDKLATNVVLYDNDCFALSERLKAENKKFQATIKSQKYRNLFLLGNLRQKQQALEEQASDPCPTCKKYKRKYKKIKGENKYLKVQIKTAHLFQIENLKKRKFSPPVCVKLNSS